MNNGGGETVELAASILVRLGIEVDYKHRSFNPMWAGLAMVCATMEEDGWMLYHIVPVNTYESIAVFVRPRQVLDEESEVKFPGEYL